MYYPRFEVQISPDCMYYPRFEESTKYFQTCQNRPKRRLEVRDRNQVVVCGGRKEKGCRRLKTIDAISRQ